MINGDAMSKKKVLIVDDDPRILEVLKERFHSEGYEVLTADDGFVALKLVEEERPDLVILDVIMPDLDGCQVMERIRRFSSPAKNVPIIIMSGKSEMEGRFNGYDIHSFIQKPFDSKDLLRQARELLE